MKHSNNLEKSIEIHNKIGCNWATARKCKNLKYSNEEERKRAVARFYR